MVCAVREIVNSVLAKAQSSEEVLEVEVFLLEDDVENERVASLVIGAAIRIHRQLGPGLMEAVYETLLAHELRLAGMKVLRQQSISFACSGVQFEDGFRVDLLVEDRLVVELKSVAKLEALFARQALTYLRLMNLNLALVINFGSPTLRESIRRVINSMPPL